jgi:O-antigen ligase
VREAISLRGGVPVWAALIGLQALALLVALVSPELAILFVAATAAVVILVQLLISRDGALVVVVVLLLAVIVLPEDLALRYRVPIAGGGIYISDLLLAPLLIAWAVALLVRRTVTVTRTACMLPLALLVLWAAVCAAVGHLGGNASKPILQDSRSLVYFVLFFWVVTMVDDRRGVLVLLKALAACIPAAFLVGLIYTARGMATPTGFVEAGVARFPAPNEVFLIGSILLIGWVALWPRGRPRPRVLWILLGVALVGLMLSLVRGYWVGLVVGLAYLFVLLRGSERVRLVGGVVVVGVLLGFGTAALSPALFESVVSRAAAVTAVGDPNVQYRLLENQAVLKQVRQRPLTGYGLGKSFTPDYTKYGVPRAPQWYIHNNYLWILQRMGVVGLALFAWFVIAFLFPRGGLRRLPVEKDPWLGGIAIGSRALLVALLFVSITSPQFNTMGNVAAVATVLGTAEVARRLLDEPAGEAPG